MNRKFFATVCVLATMLFAGCDSPVETVTVEMTNSTVATTEPAMRDFEFGEEIWVVEFADDDECAWLVRYAVVGQQGDLVEVVPWSTSDIEQLRETMGDSRDGYMIDMSQIYRDKYEAMVAVAEANGESFEEYWGRRLRSDIYE